MTHVLESLEAGREAAARYSWKEAFELLSAADTDGVLTARDVDVLAQAAWWTGRLEEALALRERAYAAYMKDGERQAAALIALTLAADYGFKAALSVSNGWLQRAERLLEGEKESIAHAHLEVARSFRAQVTGDFDAGIASAERAYELATRLNDRDVQSHALVFKGRALTRKGDVAQGLALLDEATAAAVSGDLSPITACSIYCVTISACQGVGDYRRAVEWTQAANRWCDRLDVSGFPGACRVHQAELTRLQGDWPQAETQALQACEELHDFNRWVTAGGFVEIGEIRRRRGDFKAAEEAFAKATELGHDAQPGLALLRLGEGKIDAALSGIRRALADQHDPFNRARRLPAHVEISLAAGDLAGARAAAAELEQIADAYRLEGERTAVLSADVELAEGSIRLAENDLVEAIAALRRAARQWNEMGAPYEAARARMLLGVAYRRHGDENGATEELDAALATFERLGATLDAERAKELLGKLETLRTFMFTDIVGSTELMQVLGAEKWKKALARHDRLLRERITASGGEVIKQTGDGFFAAFFSPAAAVESAVAVQRALDDEVLSVRIGLHTGGAFHSTDEGDYGGEGVHVAARVGAAAGGAEILATEETLDGVAVGFAVSDARDHDLKGLGTHKLVAIDWR
jgi:class 3 adenylate cyclase